MSNSINGEWFSELAINKAIIEKDARNAPHYEALDQFVFQMQEKLDQPQWYLPVAFTPHDFTHHVKTVLQYGSEILGEELSKFKIDDLLVFQYACTLHDIDMVYNPYGREKHSLAGNIILDKFAGDTIVKTINEKFENIVDSISDLDEISASSDEVKRDLIDQIHSSLGEYMKHSITDDNYRKAIGQIILGHSDIKLKSGGRIDTLSNAFYQDRISCTQAMGTMKTRILAAVLRFSDELDCSNRRIRGILNAAPPAEGIKYWERLKLISDVEFKMPYIRLIIDNNYIRHSPNQEECFEWLQEVYTKIEQERALVVQCFKEEGSALHIAEVQLDFGRNGLRKEYDGFLEKKKSSPPSEENLEEQQSPTHLDVEGLKSRIRDRVEEKNLFCEVHHYISGKEKGMRNHLDCNGLLTDPDIVVGIVNAFINNIYTQTFENGISEIANSDYLLVGVANSGVLLASRIAMITGLPMVYYVPPRKDEQFTVREKEWKNYLDDIEKRKAILILGVNVTGDSIQNAKEFLHTVSPEGRPIQIEAVLGIVNRDKSNAYLNELRNNGTRVDFLLNEYPIDWCNYTDGDCPYHRQCLEREKK